MTGPLTGSRAWYEASIADFLRAPADAVLGQLATNNQFTLLSTQRNAWIEQLGLLRNQLEGLEGQIFLEFNIPRIGRRIDVVLLVGPIVFVIEFKVGERTIDRGAIDQVWDYALDLKNFHAASHAASIVPLLLATEAEVLGRVRLIADDDGVYRPVSVSSTRLREAINSALETITGTAVDRQYWSRAPYRPTPTIIEAARALYAQHSVEAIARYDAGAQNLAVTSTRIENLVDEARVKGRKLICFVTGVPGGW